MPVRRETKISCGRRTASSTRNIQVGHGSAWNAAIRDEPSGVTTPGAYSCEEIGKRPSGVSTQASKPLTRTKRPAGGIVAASSSA